MDEFQQTEAKSHQDSCDADWYLTEAEWPQDYTIVLDDKAIKQVYTTKYLGVTIDNHAPLLGASHRPSDGQGS